MSAVKLPAPGIIDTAPVDDGPRYVLLGLGQAMRMVQVVASHLPVDGHGALDGGLSTSPAQLVTEVIEALADEGYVIARLVRP